VANGGSRKDRSAALAALQKEQREADEAKYEMERVAAEVANTLKAIHDQVGALSRAVKSAKSRLNQNESDAPEG
jgi:predicted  nucleic acid-binding Zn-ribbon protein